MSYQALFYPQSIAVIGASRREKTVGNDVVKNLLQQGYSGKVYPINPKADQLHGHKVYPSVDEVPGKIDLAILAIPAAFVSSAIEQAAAKGAQAVIVISAGFKEAGNQQLELDLHETCQKLNITLVGPNCLGVINPEISMNASFACKMPQRGNVALLAKVVPCVPLFLTMLKEWVWVFPNS